MRVYKSTNLSPVVLSIFIVAICVFGATAASVQAATFTVDTLADDATKTACTTAPDDCSLRGAIENANANAGADVIEFDTANLFSSPQTITLGGTELTITDELTINGPDARKLTISGNNVSRVFTVVGVTSISGLTISEGIEEFGGGIRSFNQLTVNNCTISANQGGGIYHSGATLSINNSTISGNSGSGLVGGTIIVSNSTISGNSSPTGFGAGIFVDYGGNVTVRNSTIVDNTAFDAIENFGTLAIDSSIVQSVGGGNPYSGDHNLIGGDPKLGPLTDNGGATRTHALLFGSPAIDKGKNSGAVANDQRGGGFPRTINDPNVVDSIDGDGTDIGAVESSYLVVNTTAEDDDGACQPLASGDCTLREAITTANAAPGTETIVFDIPTADPGYDAVADRYTIILTSVLPDLQSDMNIIGLGANHLIVKRDPNAPAFRIFNTSGTVAILGLTISGGSASFGGGIQNYDWATLSLTDCSILGNSASGSGAGGGGIFNDGTLTVTGSTISGNSSNGFAGGIRNFGRLSVTGSTISGNYANRSAGGLENVFGDTMAVTNSTITGNRADADGSGNGSGGGVVTGVTGAETFYNTIVAGNFLGTGTLSNDVEGTIDTAKYNLIGDAASSGGITNGTNGNIVGNSGTGTIDINTILNTTLADNGGPTKTHALVCDSPALDAGSNTFAAGLTTDQRGVGFPRIFNATVDIGAFEVQAPLVCNTAPVANGDLRSTDEDTPLLGSSVLGNDTDGENDALTAILVTGPTNAQSFTLNSDGSFSYAPNANFNGSDSFTYKANDGSLDSNEATVTITVNPVNDAPVASATPNSQSVQYSDPISNVTVTALDVDSTTLTATTTFKVGAGAFGNGLPSGLSLASPVCAPSGSATSCQWTLSGKANVAAGTYVIRVTVSDGGLTTSSDVTLIVNKEKTEAVYTGDVFMFTAGPTVTTANVRLSAQLTQEADGNAGDITKAKVSFLLFKSSNLGTTPDLTVTGVPVDAAGTALKFVNLGVDTWTVKVKIDADNGYWKASPVGMGTVTVEQPTNELRTSGGGWVADAQSMNGKGNFGFNVANQKKGVRGGSVYLFRGLDGFIYLVKNTSWQSGGIGFSSEGAVLSKAAFSGKCVVQKIDSDTGDIVDSYGNYSFTIDVRDGDLFNPRQVDKYAITVLNSNGLVWRQIGSRTNPPAIGGGNITVKGK